MKRVKFLLIVLFLGLSNVCGAYDARTDIDAQIAKIQAAPADKRVELMNNLKRSVAAMNEAQRAIAIAQLRKKMRSSHQNSESTQINGTEYTQEMQMQANEQQIQMQNMNHNRVADQIVNNVPAMIPSINESMQKEIISY